MKYILLSLCILVFGIFIFSSVLKNETKSTEVVLTNDSSPTIIVSTTTVSENIVTEPVQKLVATSSIKSAPKEDSAILMHTYTISISDYKFLTAVKTIHIGDTVTWINQDQASHTVTNDTGMELFSDYFTNTESYSHTFTQKGIFNYHCKPHPWMKGTVIVE